MKGRIYSVGYEGLTLTGFIERLVQSQVSVLVDVRLNAVSRRPGFSKKALAAGLEAAGIRYVHEPLLGNPQENRDSFREGDGTSGRSVMRTRLENGSRSAVDALVAETRSARVAVMCLERDPHSCHRQVITEMVEELEPEIEVLHLL
jgi:uncharacterized protein (DUF488 family)